MTNQNMKDFTTNWILFGLLLFSLMSFAIGFFYNNNPTGLGSSQDIFENSVDNISESLLEIETEGNEQMNISALIESGSADAGTRVATSKTYGLFGSATTFFNHSKLFLSWMMSGITGQIIIGVVGGLFLIAVIYFSAEMLRRLF